MHRMKLPKRYRHNPLLAKAIERNIETILEIQEQMNKGRTLQDHFADSITAFFGSMKFVYFHVLWFGVWIFWNVFAPEQAFDPFPFGLLTMIVSLEAIFLSTFVLISQNRQAALADKRADLDLQINLLAEYEVTKLLRLTDALAEHFHLKEGNDKEIEELERTVPPDQLLQEFENRRQHKRDSNWQKPPSA